MDDGNPIHPSLHQPALIGGANRFAVVWLYVIAAILVFALRLTWVSFGAALTLVLIGHPLLILLTRYDPDWYEIFIRHIRQQAYYPAHAHPLMLVPPRRRAVPRRKDI